MYFKRGIAESIGDSPLIITGQQQALALVLATSSDSLPRGKGNYPDGEPKPTPIFILL